MLNEWLDSCAVDPTLIEIYPNMPKGGIKTQTTNVIDNTAESVVLSSKMFSSIRNTVVKCTFHDVHDRNVTRSKASLVWPQRTHDLT